MIAIVILQRNVSYVKRGKVESISGKDIDIKADSIYVHSDGEKALEFVKEIRRNLKSRIDIETF